MSFPSSLSAPRSSVLRPFPLHLVLLALAGIHPAFAQREVRGLSAVSLEYGMNAWGTYYATGFEHHLSNAVRVQSSFLVELHPELGAPQSADQGSFRAAELALGIAPTLFHLGEFIYVRVPLEGRGRYERYSPAATAPATAQPITLFAAGGSAGLEADLYLSNRFSFFAKARQNWFNQSLVNSEFPRYYGVGLTIHLGI